MATAKRLGRADNYPYPSSASATVIMRANVSKDTGPELRLRSALHRAGARYRVHQSIRVDAGRPVLVDVVFPRRRMAVFVDGCFWHSCPAHGEIPKANRGYWLPKLRKNQERDQETTRRLEAAGWKVVRVWEHEDVRAACKRVLAALTDRQPHGSLGADHAALMSRDL